MTATEGCSRIPGFYKLTPPERRAVLEAVLGEPLSAPEHRALVDGVEPELLDGFIENVVGAFPLPLGVAVNFVVDGRELLVPMVVEESSVVAAASNMARLVRATGGFRTAVLEDLMIGQVQLLGVADPEAATRAIVARTDEVIARANDLDPRLVALGGGCAGLEVRTLEAPSGPMVVVHLLVNCLDAMGANAVNTMCEALAPDLARWAGGRPGLRILSNLADRRRFEARCVVPLDALRVGDQPGEAVAAAIASAAEFAEVDPYRATTHNKGIMNGVDPIVIATGNDWRAIEAGAHAFASRSGRYTSLSSWTLQDDGLHGRLELPLQLGIVGGVTRLHPLARVSLRLLGARTAQDLSRTVVAVGLAQNLGALRALATEGIQRGHMRLHQRNLTLAEELDR